MPRENVMLEDVRIIFRNFAGKESPKNRAGARTFNVLLDDDTAERLSRDGWNVKWLKPRDEGDPAQAHLPVTVSYKIRPPRILLVTGQGRTNLDEDTVEMLDWVDIRNVDLTISPSHWEMDGNTGIKAYLRSIFVTIEEDALDRKYADLEQVPSRGGRIQ